MATGKDRDGDHDAPETRHRVAAASKALRGMTEAIAGSRTSGGSDGRSGQAPARDRDQVVAEFVARQAAFAAARDAAKAPAMEGLRTIVAAIRQHPGTGQVRRLVAFLGGLYNGPRFPFDLTELRSLDGELASACLDVLRYDHFSQAEVHTWGVIDGDELNAQLESYGLYYAAQQRRIGRELYRERFGEDGHPDEGCSA